MIAGFGDVSWRQPASGCGVLLNCLGAISLYPSVCDTQLFCWPRLTRESNPKNCSQIADWLASPQHTNLATSSSTCFLMLSMCSWSTSHTGLMTGEGCQHQRALEYKHICTICQHPGRGFEDGSAGVVCLTQQVASRACFAWPLNLASRMLASRIHRPPAHWQQLNPFLSRRGSSSECKRDCKLQDSDTRVD